MEGKVIKEQSVSIEELYLTYILAKRQNRYGDTVYSLFITEVFRDEKEFILLDDLTNDLKEALRLFSLFCEGAVTVCTALDVLEEVMES